MQAVQDGNQGTPDLSADPTVAGRCPNSTSAQDTAAVRHV